MFDLEGRRHHRPPHRPTRRRHRLRRDLPRRRVRSRRRRHRRRARRLARGDEHVEQRAWHVAAQPGPLPRSCRTTGGGVGRGPRPRVRRPRRRRLDQGPGLPAAHVRHRHPTGRGRRTRRGVVDHQGVLVGPRRRAAPDRAGPARPRRASSSTRGPTVCCSRWAARSTRVPTRFSATSSPSACWAYPGSRSEIRLDDQQRDFASSIDGALGAADVPAAVRAWAAGDTGPGRKVWSTLAELGVTALMVPESLTASRPTRSIWWWRWNASATSACRDRSPNPLRWHRSCSPTTSAAAAWRRANSSPPSRCRHTCRGQSTPTSPG